MPLETAKIQFKASLLTIFKDLYGSVDQKVQLMSTAIHMLLLQGIPQTQVTGAAASGQVVVAYTTTTPCAVSGSGLGGLDKPTPGVGLDVAKTVFVTTMVASFKNFSNDPNKAAGDWADALVALYAEAKVMTQVTGILAPGSVVAPTVPPTGVVGVGSWAGGGNGGIENTNGTGLLPASLSAALKEAFINLTGTAEESASKVADAVINFAKTAAITTTDSGVAGGGLATITPPLGAYIGGDGATISPSPASGNGSGSLI